MEIRKAHPADQALVVQLDHVATHEKDRVAFITRAIHAGACFVCTESGRILGYGVLEYSFYERGFISMVCVAVDQRRQGIGSALLRAMEEHCSTSKLFTSTNQTKVPMQSLLRKRGYVESGVIFNLDPGDPELIYFKQLRQDVA